MATKEEIIEKIDRKVTDLWNKVGDRIQDPFHKESIDLIQIKNKCYYNATQMDKTLNNWWTEWRKFVEEELK